MPEKRGQSFRLDHSSASTFPAGLGAGATLLMLVGLMVLVTHPVVQFDSWPALPLIGGKQPTTSVDVSGPHRAAHHGAGFQATAKAGGARSALGGGAPLHARNGGRRGSGGGAGSVPTSLPVVTQAPTLATSGSANIATQPAPPKHSSGKTKIRGTKTNGSSGGSNGSGSGNGNGSSSSSDGSDHSAHSSSAAGKSHGGDNNHNG